MQIDNEIKRQPVPTVKLTAAQDTKMQTAIAYLLVHQPFFSDIMLRKLPIVYSTVCPVAATDHFSIIINPETFFDDAVLKDHKQRAFVLGHEVLHYVFNDVIQIHDWNQHDTITIHGKDYPWINEIMQHAMDYRINALLKQVDRLVMPDKVLYDPELSEKGMESNLDIYAKIYEEAKKDGRIKQGGGEGGGDGFKGKPGKTPFDKILPPGTTKGEAPGPASRKASDSDRAVTVAAAAQAAELMGKLPASLKRLVGDILEPKVSWQDAIKTSINRAFGEDGYDWTMPNRRLICRSDPIYFARSSSFGCGTVAIGIDTSGSITQAMVDRFFGEMGGIVSDLNPARLIVIWCDAKVDRVDILDQPEDLVGLKAKIDDEGFGGGGGTDFRPVFEEIAALDEDIEGMVFFTDLYGSFPAQPPSYPTIWASINDTKGPWGDTVHVEL